MWRRAFRPDFAAAMRRFIRRDAAAYNTLRDDFLEELSIQIIHLSYLSYNSTGRLSTAQFVHVHADARAPFIDIPHTTLEVIFFTRAILIYPANISRDIRWRTLFYQFSNAFALHASLIHHCGRAARENVLPAAPFTPWLSLLKISSLSFPLSVEKSPWLGYLIGHASLLYIKRHVIFSCVAD